MNIEECRRFYAEEIRFAAGVSSESLIEAFARVPREAFVGPAPWSIGSSFTGVGELAYSTTDDPRHVYHNLVIALDSSRNLNNGQPGALARWIDALNLRTGDRVFHLGCGVGYYTAIMAEVVGPEGSVIASEVDTELAARAKANLSGYPNVAVYAEDGAATDPGSCDAMLINAGVTHPHPGWLDRLREGGRLVLPLTIPLGNSGLGQGVMLKIGRERGGRFVQIVSAVAIYSCTSVRDARLEPVLAKAFATQTLLKMKSVRRDQHEQSETCVVHHGDVCLSSEPLTPS